MAARRSLLLAVALCLALAGCSGPTGGSSAFRTLTPVDVPPPSGTATGAPTGTPTDSAAVDRVTPASPTPAALYWEDGDSGPADRVVVTGATDRTVAVTVTRDGTTLVDRALSVSPGRPVRVVRLTHGTYTVRVAHGGTATTRTFSVPHRAPASVTRTVRFALAADGNVTTRVVRASRG